MSMRGYEDRDKIRKEMARRAVAFAMNNRWEQAATLNRAIVQEFSDDLEAYNRLGKALSELGRNREARAAFQTVLRRSPNNSIAKKNLSRLTKLADAATPRATRRAGRGSRSFVEESGKAGVTTLRKIAAPETLLELTPGDVALLKTTGRSLTVTDESGAYIGQVEPRVGNRIARLMRGGNLYEATITGVEDRRLDIIIRETYKSPSQTNVVSFPSRSGAAYGGYVPPSQVMGGYDVADEENELPPIEKVAIKDWSSDDTEPGDDEAFSPVVHRIITSPDDDGDSEAEDYEEALGVF